MAFPQRLGKVCDTSVTRHSEMGGMEVGKKEIKGTCATVIYQSNYIRVFS